MAMGNQMPPHSSGVSHQRRGFLASNGRAEKNITLRAMSSRVSTSRTRLTR